MPATISGGSQSTTYSITTPDDYTLDTGTTRTQTAGTGIQATVTSGTTNIFINGTLNATGFTTATSGGLTTRTGARAIRAGLAGGQITVGATGLVQATDTDAIQAQTPGGSSSTGNLTNLGRILSLSTNTTISSTGTVGATGYALNYAATVGASGAPTTDYASGGLITNGSLSNTTALIRSDSGDAIRLGSHQTLVNYGTINGNGLVNDASTNNVYAGTSTAQRYDNSRGVRIAGSSTNDRIDNYGTVTGAQHGVDVGNTAAANIVVNNLAGGQIIGRNGSGVGSDTTGVAAGTVVVTNSGLIRGAYAPQYDRAGLVTTDGDGDGVDIDGGATVVNNAGATIEGTGAGGYDSNGRLNNSEGISIGGGSITNSGTIRGASFAIVVNNDSNTDGSRSGVLATQITNNATGTITGQGGYAIRLENKTGTAAGDNDTLVNYGTITGNGTVPDTSQTVLRQGGAADAGTVGTLDGVTYTASDAGSVRFIRGDGSAVQTGEGDDVVTNYGTLTGDSGRALNLEGGADTLNLYTGSSVSGRLDGGAGSDTLNLRLDDRSASGTDTGVNSGVTTGTLANTVNFETLAVQGGTWTINDAEGFSSGATIANGAVLELGSAAVLTATVDVASGGTLRGVGQAGAVTIRSGGLLSAGAGASGTGTLGTGNLTLASGASLREQIGGRSAGSFDRIGVTGTVDLGGADLDLSFGAGFTSAGSDSFTIVDNDGSADAVTGRFSSGGSLLAEGADLLVSGRRLRISYAGGDGNDVTLTDVTPNYGIAVSPASVREGTAAGSGNTLTYTVTRSSSGTAATVAVDLATGSTADGSDYTTTLQNGQVSFGANDLTATFTVTTTPDATVEPDETVVATLGTPSDGGGIVQGQGSATGTILNDDAPTRSRGDLTGDGTSDILLQSSGSLVNWAMGQGRYQSGNVIGGVGDYTAFGTGDFNGDGTADLLLQNGSTVVDWIMANGQYQSGNVVQELPAGYTIRAVGDFNGDGTDDIVLQNGSTVVEWTMANGRFQSSRVIGDAGGYTVVGAGDFNGDGTADLLLQNGSTVVDWLMSGGQYQSGNVIGDAGSYTVAGTGDFNGDGTADILLQNGSSVVDWIMANGRYQSGNRIGDAGSFTVAAVGDYNGDGTSDIALRNGSTVVGWQMQGGRYDAGTVVGDSGSYALV